MNISFPIGIILAFCIILFGMVAGKDAGALARFIDPSSLFITCGGTLAALFATAPFKSFSRIYQHFPIIMGFYKQDPLHYINIMTDLSQEARRKGLLALEDDIAQFDDAFLRNSVMIIVDASNPDKVREQLENELSNIEARHAQSWELYDRGAALAPAFGMLGTLIGLINMIAGMNFEDEGGAALLAQSLAIALRATFYGLILANLIFIPCASQLRAAHNEEMLCKEIVIEGVVSIQAGENPRRTNERLMAFLTNRQREQIAANSENLLS